MRAPRRIGKRVNENVGYQSITNENPQTLKKIFENNLTVFTGQSGAGKSTLINLLNEDLNLKTNDISKALGRGKHTTRHVELYNIYGLCSEGTSKTFWLYR